jgi:hypothetical protein
VCEGEGVNFIHEDEEFKDLVLIVAAARGLSAGLVEKDYWVTHALWSLHEQGWQVWFKGGTSLSKGFGLIKRFSEDLDLKVEPGEEMALKAVENWKSEKRWAVDARRVYFEELVKALSVQGASLVLEAQDDETWRGAQIQVHYAGSYKQNLAQVMRPFVLLEIGDARVTPFVERALSSFVHEHLEQLEMLGQYRENRPMNVRCVHPLVTLWEKLDALTRRFERGASAATFVRHYEDAARIIEHSDGLPALDGYHDVWALGAELLEQKQVRSLPSPTHPALVPQASDVMWSSLEHAYGELAPMYWGERQTLTQACEQIAGWLALKPA